MSEPAKVVFNLVVRVASVVFLATLLIGLVAGANPVIAASRSMGAFVAFTLLGWAGAQLLSVPAAEGATAASPESATPGPPASAPNPASPGGGPAEAAQGGPAAPASGHSPVRRHKG